MFAFLRRSVTSALPLYSPLEANNDSAFPTGAMPSFPAASDDLHLKPAQRHATAATAPTLARFLADFTLGFADGLTVPFALTAGLSSLGRTETVIYAGMAEICAGSISMGVGGYLSARGPAGRVVDDGAEGGRDADEKAGRVVDRYLAPLDLPPGLLELVREHVADREDVAAAVERQAARGEEEEDDDGPPPPWMSGLSVAIGYLIGGSLPLFPYFYVEEVGDGLLWSFVVCVIALFTFGFVKDFVLHMESAKAEAWAKEASWTWRGVRRSSWEGAQMVILGSLAALAAVLCVRLFEGMGHDGSEP